MLGLREKAVGTKRQACLDPRQKAEIDNRTKA